MRKFLLALATSALIGLGLSGCGIGVDDVATATGADQAAASTMEDFIASLGYQDVKVESKKNDGPADSTPAPGTVQVLSAVVGHPKLSCKINLERGLNPSDSIYFDAVIVDPAKPDGVEVQGDARNNTNPIAVLTYVTTTHPQCVLGEVLPSAVPTQ